MDTWRTSSYSGAQNNCVQINGGLDAVRDSKNPSGPALRLVGGQLADFIAAIKAERFS